METILTLSQNGALSFAHAACKMAQARAALFRKFAAAAAVQRPDVYRRTSNDLQVYPKFHPDNGK